MYDSLCTVVSPCIHWHAVLGEILAWSFFGAPFFDARQYGSCGVDTARNVVDIPDEHQTVHVFMFGVLLETQFCSQWVAV